MPDERSSGKLALPAASCAPVAWATQAPANSRWSTTGRPGRAGAKVPAAETAWLTTAVDGSARAAVWVNLTTVLAGVVTAARTLPPSVALGAKTRYVVLVARAAVEKLKAPFGEDCFLATCVQDVPCLRCRTTVRDCVGGTLPLKVTRSPAIALLGDAVNPPPVFTVAAVADGRLTPTVSPVTSTSVINLPAGMREQTSDMCCPPPLVERPCIGSCGAASPTAHCVPPARRPAGSRVSHRDARAGRDSENATQLVSTAITACVGG